VELSEDAFGARHAEPHRGERHRHVHLMSAEAHCWGPVPGAHTHGDRWTPFSSLGRVLVPYWGR